MGARTTATYLSRLLHIGPGEAQQRVRAADDLGPRRGLTGEQLSAMFPVVAAAQASGLISERHAHAVIAAVQKLPDLVRKEHEEQVETDLVDVAVGFDPTAVTVAGIRIAAHLDPDGVLQDVEHRHARRHISTHRRPDGTLHGTFDLDLETSELAAVTLAALAKPRPETDGIRDRRTAGQRNHDALGDLMRAAMRAEQLPATNGVDTTVIITITEQQLQSGDGLAETGTGALVPVTEALRWASSDSRWFSAVLTRTRNGLRVSAYSPICRLFIETQRPDGGPTTIDNGTLLCGFTTAASNDSAGPAT